MSQFRRFRTSSSSSVESFKGQHRYEHWYLDNQVYFITARCRERFPAFASDRAKQIFWDRFDNYTGEFGFTPWVTSLLDNHYHTLGYLREGENLGPLMQRLHGSVAKLVNDQLPSRRVPFWREAGHRDYFDGCIRDDKQCRRAYKYTLLQAVRHGIVADWRDYPHTRVAIELERGVKRALELRAFLEHVPYKRYATPKDTGR
jgi:REP element-mobilizing transposase RayT